MMTNASADAPQHPIAQPSPVPSSRHRAEASRSITRNTGYVRVKYIIQLQLVLLQPIKSQTVLIITDLNLFNIQEANVIAQLAGGPSKIVFSWLSL